LEREPELVRVPPLGERPELELPRLELAEPELPPVSVRERSESGAQFEVVGE